MLAAPNQRWHFALIATTLVFTLLFFGNSFLDEPYKPALKIPDILKSAPVPVWLIATVTPANGMQRRSIIRNTWQRLYKNDSIITTRFVVANPGPLWLPVLIAENATFGDIIMLDHIDESARTANTIKSVEFLKHLTTQPQKYSFVTKLDDDSFLDSKTFYEEYLHPRIIATPQPSSDLETPSSSPMNRTIFARTLHRGKYSYPGGQFYTMTWDLVSLLAKLHTENPITDEHEDVMVGRLLFEAGEAWEHIDLPNPVSFDYGDKGAINGSAWAAEGADLEKWVHPVGQGAINPHKMRDDATYLSVAACYDERGLKQRLSLSDIQMNY
jgi:hypothetical protein